MRKADMIKLTGLIGILGAVLTFASDMILLGRPVSASEFLQWNTETMAFIEDWKITIGTFAGILFLPLQIIGLIPLYQGLKPAGRRMPHVVALFSAHALIMGVAFHTSYAFIADGWKLKHAVEAGNSMVSGLVEKFSFYWTILLVTMFVELMISSAVFVALILKGKTLYPKWMAVFNPICVFLILYPLILLLPVPVGGYIAPGYLNLSVAAFFTLSTLVVSKRVKA